MEIDFSKLNHSSYYINNPYPQEKNGIIYGIYEEHLEWENNLTKPKQL